MGQACANTTSNCLSSAAGIPTSATLESFDWEFNVMTIYKSSVMELACGELINRGDNLACAGRRVVMDAMAGH